jgi:hypothetical protein
MKVKDTQGEYKSLVIAGLVIIVVILLFIRQCGRGNPEEPTIQIDTVYEKIEGKISYVPRVDTIYYPRDKFRFRWDTIYFEQQSEEPGMYIDTCNYREFYATRIYRDTLRNKFGHIVVTDSVSQNKIQGRGVVTDLNIPLVTKIITLPSLKRGQLYIGANLLGNESDPLSGYNVNLAFKTKRDRMIEAGYNQLFGGEHYYSVGIKWKISFRKQ